jgi:hypothetical protein
MFFFRHLRHMELKKRTGRYLLYAFGEIFLVVVGILIALALNNWKEERADEVRRSELIVHLIADFETNTSRASESAALTQKRYSDLLNFLKVSAGERNGVSAEEARILATASVDKVNFFPAMGTYEMALSTGSIGLLNDPVLNDLFLEWKQSFEHFQLTQQWGGAWALGESLPELRRIVGSVHILFEKEFYKPKMFELSDEEFFEVIRQKEVYGIFETREWIMRNHAETLIQMEAVSGKILARLKAL